MHKGELLVTFDLEKIKKAGYKVTTPMVICNEESYKTINLLAKGAINATDNILKLD